MRLEPQWRGERGARDFHSGLREERCRPSWGRLLLALWHLGVLKRTDLEAKACLQNSVVGCKNVTRNVLRRVEQEIERLPS